MEKVLQTNNLVLPRIIDFLTNLGISVIEKELSSDTFLPGLALGPNCIYLDSARMLYQGDLLHEAGHLAVAEPAHRMLFGTAQEDPAWLADGFELSAILWSYAALTHLGLDPEVVFHQNGYKGDAQWLIDNFAQGTFIGIPFFQWLGFAADPNAPMEGLPPYPAMKTWLRK